MRSAACRGYDWAERRKLETHPKTGAAQWVEIRETVQEVLIPRYVEELKPVAAAKPLFAHVSDEDLLRHLPRFLQAQIRADRGEGVPGQ